MFFRNQKKPQSRIDTLIGEETRLEGDIDFVGGLRIDGQVRGNVNSTGAKPSTLILSERGRIEGAINVSHAVVNGAVVGPLRALEYVELQAKARVTGDVLYKTLEMHMGAVVEGSLIYLGDTTVVDTVED